MKVYIFASLFFASASASFLEEHVQQFKTFKATYNKTYRNQVEEATRFSIFRENIQEIEKHNELYAYGLVSYQKGINHFTDLSNEEIRTMLTLSSSIKPEFNATSYIDNGLAAPASIDWRNKGYITGVKNQGNCGACWAFSVTGGTEAAYFKKTKKLVSLSEQQMLDCTTKINKGCNGGYLDGTYNYVKQSGLVTESSYPYKAKQGTCKFSASSVVTRINSYVAIRKSDENALLQVVGTVGPVSVGIDATHLSQYASGIYDDGSCSRNSINHAVLIVGYGVSNGKKYWIVKNSWGSGWGEKGFFRLARGTNKCGVADMAVYPIIH